jgi:two-component system, cell cycle response regulator DivK
MFQKMVEENSMDITGRDIRNMESGKKDFAETGNQSGKAENSLYDSTEELPENKILNQTSNTILIAEDDEFNFLLIESLLVRNGYDIIRAGNGSEAVHLHIKKPDVCLILMDLQMPEMDGFAATKKIRELDKLIPIIAQTAFVVPGIKEKALSSGCDAFLTKPIDPEALITQINCLLDNSKKMVAE